MKILYRLGCVLLCMQLAGCAGMHLYSEKRDQQGKDLKQAWAKVDLPGYFDAMQQQRKKLLQAQLDTTAASQAANLNASLRELVFMPVGYRNRPAPDTFLSKINKELGQVSGAGNEPEFSTLIGTFRAASSNLKSNRGWQDMYRHYIYAEGVKESLDCLRLPSVDQAASQNQPVMVASPQAHRAEYLRLLTQLCVKEKSLIKQQRDASGKLGSGGLLGQELVVANEFEGKFSAAQAQALVKEKEYRDALAEYEDAVRATASGPLPSERIAKAGHKLRGVLAVIAQLDNVFADEIVEKDRVRRLDGVLASVSEGAEPGKDASRAEIAGYWVTRIADDAQLYAQLQKPLVPASVLLQLNMQKIIARLAQEKADLQRKRLDLTRDIVDSLIEQAWLLDSARSIAVSLPASYEKTVFIDAASLPANASDAVSSRNMNAASDRANLYDVAGKYLMALGSQKTNTLQLIELRKNIGYEESIRRAKTNVDLWALLIDTSVGQSAEYAASGQKVADYNALFQSLALVWIGKGVRK